MKLLSALAFVMARRLGRFGGNDLTGNQNVRSRNMQKHQHMLDNFADCTKKLDPSRYMNASI